MSTSLTEEGQLAADAVIKGLTASGLNHVSSKRWRDIMISTRVRRHGVAGYIGVDAPEAARQKLIVQFRNMLLAEEQTHFTLSRVEGPGSLHGPRVVFVRIFSCSLEGQ